MSNMSAIDEFHGVDAALQIDPKTIEEAAQRIAPNIIRTPLLESPRLNEWLGFRLLVKAENLQHTGSFKLRGASNAIMSLGPDVSRVFAYSSGNHAQGVARAASARGISATILMPKDSPQTKIEGTKAFGAHVITYDRTTENREEIGERLAAETGATLIRPYEDSRVIAGQGTVGLEIAEQCAELGVIPDHFVCCCGGGGLISGSSIALKSRLNDIQIWSAEPTNYEDTMRSLASGKIETADLAHTSICDAIVTPRPGDMTFAINRNMLSGGFAVTDDFILKTMATAFTHLKLVSEPGGAVALAAVLGGNLPANTKCAIAVISGGNVDASMFKQAFDAGSLL